MRLKVETGSSIEQELTFHVVETNQQGFLEETATNGSSLTTRTSQELKEGVFQNHAQVFTGLGRLEKPYHIETDPTVSPIINPPRTVLAAL